MTASITSSPVLWYATRATGLMAMLLLSATVVLGVLTFGHGRTHAFPRFAVADLHRRVSLLTLVFLALHILTTVLDTYVHISWLSVVVPFTSSYRPLWLGFGAVAFDCLLAVSISSALRTRISSRLWRGLHWLAYACWPAAMSHAFGAGTDSDGGWALGLGLVCIFSVVAAIAWRLARRTQPFTHGQRPVVARHQQAA